VSGAEMAKYQRLDEVAYQYIKEKIYTRQWLPQTHITEINLSKELNISRTPIRQAFQQLEKDGYLDVQAYKGARVREQKIRVRGLQERMEFIEMIFIHYLYYLQIKEIQIVGNQIGDNIISLKDSRNESEKKFLHSETQLLHTMLSFGKNDYSLKLVMDTIRELQTQNNQDYLLLMRKNRAIKIHHYESVNDYMKAGDYPLARKEIRILINKLTLSIIHNLSD
jgi:DNA-binding GntR family transcriptional regulator